MGDDLGRRLVRGELGELEDRGPGEGRQAIRSILADPTSLRFTTVGFDFEVTKSGLSFIIDGGGSVITTGIKGDIVIPYGTTIGAAVLLADQSGSIKIDIWRTNYLTGTTIGDDFPPTNSNTITGGQEPEISSNTKWSSFESAAILDAWERQLNVFDTLRINVDSVTTIQRVTLGLVFLNAINVTPIRRPITG